MLLYKLYVDVVKVNNITTSKSLRVFVNLSDDTNAIVPAKTVNKALKCMLWCQLLSMLRSMP